MTEQTTKPKPEDWLLFGLIVLGLVLFLVWALYSVAAGGKRQQLEQPEDLLLVLECEKCGRQHSIPIRGGLR